MTSLEVAEVVIDYLEAKRCSDGVHDAYDLCGHRPSPRSQGAAGCLTHMSATRTTIVIVAAACPAEWGSIGACDLGLE